MTHCQLCSTIVSSAACTLIEISYLRYSINYIAVLVVTFQESGDGKKSRVTRKHVIIAVTCAVVTAMVIAGIIVGVKFFLDSTNEIVKVSNSMAVMMKCFTALRV